MLKKSFFWGRRQPTPRPSPSQPTPNPSQEGRGRQETGDRRNGNERGSRSKNFH
ncbi:MAG: hypothetical protein F6K48_15745 [Okeania sp. SIO3H1]|nr:hypothetical protein [Okeania sp. SIO3H1]